MEEKTVFTKATTSLIVGAVAAAAFFRGKQLDLAVLAVFGVWGMRVAVQMVRPHRSAIRAWAAQIQRRSALQAEESMVPCQRLNVKEGLIVNTIDASDKEIEVVQPELTTEPPLYPSPDIPLTWYEVQGKAILEKLIIELNLQQYNSLTIRENGEICILKGIEEAVLDRFAHFPKKDCWNGLVEVLDLAGLSATAEEVGIVITW